MKVYLGPYSSIRFLFKNSIEKLIAKLHHKEFFYQIDEKEYNIFDKNLIKFENWWYLFSQRFEKERKEKVIIHDYDLWSLDYSLARIILPALVKFKEQTHGTFQTDPEDLPETMKNELKPDEWGGFYHEEAQNWILDEMIYAFNFIVEERYDYSNDEYNRHKNGLRLFGKYFRALWD